MCVCLDVGVCGPLLTCDLEQGSEPSTATAALDLTVFFLLFVIQRRNGEDIPVALTKNINHRRFAASFHLKEVTNQDQDLYRCVTQSERGSGVSNFAGLIVRGEDFF